MSDSPIKSQTCIWTKMYFSMISIIHNSYSNKEIRTYGTG